MHIDSPGSLPASFCSFSPCSSSQAGCSRKNRALRSAWAWLIALLTSGHDCPLSLLSINCWSSSWYHGLPHQKGSWLRHSLLMFAGAALLRWLPRHNASLLILCIIWWVAMRFFFPLISVIKAPSCHSYRNDTSNGNLIIVHNSCPDTFFFSPCFSLFVDALRCDTPSGWWDLWGKQQTFCWASPIPGKSLIQWRDPLSPEREDLKAESFHFWVNLCQDVSYLQQ